MWSDLDPFFMVKQWFTDNYLLVDTNLYQFSDVLGLVLFG